MKPSHSLTEAVERLPLGPLREALAEVDAYLVGGTLRDLLRGGAPGYDLDIAVDADLEELLDRLGPDVEVEVEARHERFGTATVHAGGTSIDLTRTRAETYPVPGALPDVEPAPIERDLARRDFTINAMAIPLGSPADLLDPFDGRSDLRSATLRVLHPGSFVDDPTRAIRAARYGSRLELAPDPATLDLLGATDLSAVSADRREVELARLAAEPTAAAGFRLLADWGLLDLGAETIETIETIERLVAASPWNGDPASRTGAILLAVAGGDRAKAALRLARAVPDRPSEAVRLAAGHDRPELLLAAAAGGGWLEDYARRWSSMRLEIDGGDLIAAGIPEGPAVGIGLRGALERKLDGALAGGREAELELALELARAAT